VAGHAGFEPANVILKGAFFEKLLRVATKSCSATAETAEKAIFSRACMGTGRLPLARELPHERVNA
jgi:hypothetical protein